jgi:hypothetical protein
VKTRIQAENELNSGLTSYVKNSIVCGGEYFFGEWITLLKARLRKPNKLLNWALQPDIKSIEAWPLTLLSNRSLQKLRSYV